MADPSEESSADSEEGGVSFEILLSEDDEEETLQDENTLGNGKARFEVACIEISESPEHSELSEEIEFISETTKKRLLSPVEPELAIVG